MAHRVDDRVQRGLDGEPLLPPPHILRQPGDVAQQVAHRDRLPLPFEGRIDPGRVAFRASSELRHETGDRLIKPDRPIFDQRHGRRRDDGFGDRGEREDRPWPNQNPRSRLSHVPLGDNRSSPPDRGPHSHRPLAPDPSVDRGQPLRDPLPLAHVASRVLPTSSPPV
jgi:hypothetical protein